MSGRRTSCFEKTRLLNVVTMCDSATLRSVRSVLTRALFSDMRLAAAGVFASESVPDVGFCVVSQAKHEQTLADQQRAPLRP